MIPSCSCVFLPFLCIYVECVRSLEHVLYRRTFYVHRRGRYRRRRSIVCFIQVNICVHDVNYGGVEVKLFYLFS